MKDFFRTVAFLSGYAGYALLCAYIFMRLDEHWFAPLIYSVFLVSGFWVARLMRDVEKTCPCCKAVEQKDHIIKTDSDAFKVVDFDSGLKMRINPGMENEEIVNVVPL